MDFSDVMKKKSIIGPIVSVFVLILVIAILSGLTFLFVAQLKTNAMDTSTKATFTVLNESDAWINNSGYTVTRYNEPSFTSISVTNIVNASDNKTIASGNYSVSNSGIITNASAVVWTTVKVSYTYSAIAGDARIAYESINTTEAAGATLTTYLSLIFLAVIFGAVLTLVLRIILPYINLGKNMGGF